jgi:hypothetical protein
MNGLTGDISSLIFRHVIQNHRKDISLDYRLLGIFLELDGSKTLRTIARKKGLNMAQMRDAVKRLLELDLIESVSSGSDIVDSDFLEHLLSALSRAVGPIAKILIEDEITAMGYNAEGFPSAHAAELVDLLAHEIKRPERKTVFQSDMLRKIREKKY